MVRGPGMSSGCRTCRRRHVKCDERRPRCQRCERAGFDCEGYTRDHRFIDENAKTKRSAKKRSPETSNSRSMLTLAEHGNSNGSTPSVNFVGPTNEEVCIAADLGLWGFEDEICTSFLLSHLLSGDTGFLAIPWMREHAENLASLSAQMCIRALGALYFGKLHKLKGVAARSHRFYGKALAALNDDLQQTEKAWSLSVVKTAMILELYELIDCKSTSAWMKHAGGVGKLIEMRGPWRHQSFMDRYILEGNRVTIALECLIRKKRCFLEHPDWKSVPYEHDPGSKTMMNYLHDILCDIPGLVEDAELLHSLEDSETEEAKSKHLELSQKILIELKELYEWRASWAQQNPDSWWEVETSCPSTKPIFPTVIHFKTLMVANAVTIYNAILLLLRRLGFQVMGPSFDPSGIYLDIPKDIDYGPLYAPRAAPNDHAIATEIFRTVEYHLAEERKSAGGFFMLFPLTSACQVFEKGTREAEWLRGILSRIADFSGFEIGRNLWATNAWRSHVIYPSHNDSRLVG